MKNPIDRIEELLISKLDPTHLMIDDRGVSYSSYKSLDSAKCHLKIEIESPIFNNKTKLEQHQLVLDLIKPFVNEELHTVSIETRISQE